MKIGTILRNKQPDILNELHEQDRQVHKHKSHRGDKKEHLSFSYIKNDLMKNYNYERYNGPIVKKNKEK